MTDPIITVGTAIIDLMKAEAEFDSINAFYLGEYPFQIRPHYPLCEVVIASEQENPQSTGRYWRQMDGFIRFSIMDAKDNPKLTERVATIGSYVSIVRYLQATKDLFAKQSNHTLNSTTLDNGGRVQRFTINTDVEVGIGERENNYENQGAVSFTVLTQEPRDLS